MSKQIWWKSEMKSCEATRALKLDFAGEKGEGHGPSTPHLLSPPVLFFNARRRQYYDWLINFLPACFSVSRQYRWLDFCFRLLETSRHGRMSFETKFNCTSRTIDMIGTSLKMSIRCSLNAKGHANEYYEVVTGWLLITVDPPLWPQMCFRFTFLIFCLPKCDNEQFEPFNRVI